MGVRGLTSYVDTLPAGKGDVWETYKLRDTTLIIDGNGLCHYLYATNQLNCQYGGQYRQLEEKVKEFFTKLTSHGVQPYVIFDGILDASDKKLQTVKKRKAERIKRAHNLWKFRSNIYDRNTMVLPRLTQLAFLKILQEIRVPCAVADFEADSDIASLANALDGPVMGLDSDFFIFDIKQGYIPFNCYDFSGPNMTVKRFHSDKLAKHFNISSPMLPMLASLVGNDYVSDQMLIPFNTNIQWLRSSSCQKSSSKIATIAAYLSCYKSIDEAMVAVTEVSHANERCKLKKALCLSVEEYQMKPTHLLGYFQKGDLGSDLLTYNGHRIPMWVIKLYREGAFAEQCMSCLCQRKVLLSVQVEDMAMPSAHLCTVEIRRYFCKLVTKYDKKVEELAMGGEAMVITEYDREGLSLVQYKPDLQMATYETKVDISKISTMSEDTKMSNLLSVLSCDLTLVQHLPIQQQLVVAVLRYWFINATPAVTQEHLAALLVCHVGENDRTRRRQYKPDVEGLHGFSQWQNVAYWADYFNSLFSNVFPSLHPARLYDGIQVCKLYQELKSCGIQAVRTFVVDVQLFQQLYDTVLKDLPSDYKFNQTRRARQSKEVKKPREAEPAQKSKEFLKGNHFALLCISSDTDEEDRAD